MNKNKMNLKKCSCSLKPLVGNKNDSCRKKGAYGH